MYIIKIGNTLVTENIILGRGRFVIELESDKIGKYAYEFYLPKAKAMIKTMGCGEIFEVVHKPIKLELTFDEWITIVKETFDANISIPFDAIEYPWRTIFESGWTPEEAIEEAMKTTEKEEEE